MRTPLGAAAALPIAGGSQAWTDSMRAAQLSRVSATVAVTAHAYVEVKPKLHGRMLFHTQHVLTPVMRLMKSLMSGGNLTPRLMDPSASSSERTGHYRSRKTSHVI